MICKPRTKSVIFKTRTESVICKTLIESMFYKSWTQSVFYKSRTQSVFSQSSPVRVLQHAKVKSRPKNARKILLINFISFYLTTYHRLNVFFSILSLDLHMYTCICILIRYSSALIRGLLDNFD